MASRRPKTLEESSTRRAHGERRLQPSTRDAAEGFSFELGTTDAGVNVSEYVDISSYKGIQFWVYNGVPTATALIFQVSDKAADPNGGICDNAADASVMEQCNSPVYVTLPIAHGWSFQQVPFAELASNPYWGYQQPQGGDMTTAQNVNFQVQQMLAPDAGGGPLPFNFCVADVEFFK